MRPVSRCGRRQRVSPASLAANAGEETRRNAPDVNWIRNSADAPRPSVRSLPVAANVAIPVPDARVEVSENRATSRTLRHRRLAGLAAGGGVSLRPAAVNDGSRPGGRRGNCRDVNRLEMETRAGPGTRFAAAARSSHGARPSQPIERTPNAKQRHGSARVNMAGQAPAAALHILTMRATTNSCIVDGWCL